jgi:triacylglycerol lipase
MSKALVRKLGLGLVSMIGLSVAQQSFAANNYPIILVHGFLGFGRSEMLGYKYWGGFNDIQATLQKQFPDQLIATTADGPVSSSWERAIEAFYQIKGGCVDYGAIHAQTYGILEIPENTYHNGRTCYAGYYPEWDQNHPVHLVGHSMGGQDVKMLTQLLATNGAPLNPNLFPYATSAAWVASATTISTPNDGTTLIYQFDNLLHYVTQYLGDLAVLAEIKGDPVKDVFDFKLDQWQITPQLPHESYKSYLKRIEKSPLFKGYTKDFSSYDLSPEGAMVENDWVKDQPGVTYFSIATNSSYPAKGTGYATALKSTTFLYSAFVRPIGDYKPTASRIFPYPVTNPLYKTWWPNDGVVPTVAQPAPTWAMNSSGTIYTRGTQVNDLSVGGTVDLTNSLPSTPGQWNYLGLMSAVDHIGVVGWDIDWKWDPLYTSLVTRLRSL